MRLLAIEAASAAGGCALFDGDKLLGGRQWIDRGPQTARLLPAILELLAEHGLEFGGLGLLACGVGPGRFTSLRVAVATAQGIALARDLQVVPVSTLAALAQPLLERGSPVLACLDARRGQVYAGLYAAGADGLPEPLIVEGAYAPDELAPLLPERLIAAGVGLTAYPGLTGGSGCVLAPEQMWYPSAVGVGRIALGRIDRAVDPAQLKPRYLRPSAAEYNLGIYIEREEHEP